MDGSSGTPGKAPHLVSEDDDDPDIVAISGHYPAISAPGPQDMGGSRQGARDNQLKEMKAPNFLDGFFIFSQR